MAQLISRANLLIIAAFVVAFGVIALLYARYDADLAAARYWVDHNYNVEIHIGGLQVTMDEAETAERGYLLTGDETYLGLYRAARDHSALLFAELKNLTADNPEEQDRLEKLSPLMQQKLASIAQNIEARRAGGTTAAVSTDAMQRGRSLMEQLRSVLMAMTASESRLLLARETQETTVEKRTILVAAAGAAAALLLLALGAYFVRRSDRDRRRAEQTIRDAATQLRLSFDSLSQGIAVFDGDRRLVNWNQCFLTLLDLPAETVHRGAAYGAVVGALATDGDFLETEAQIDVGVDILRNSAPVVFQRSRGDRVFELRRTMLPQRGFAITITDITTQIRTEEAQRKSQKMQALGELTGGIAHDFNNLLPVVSGNLELLTNRTKLDADGQRYVAAAMRGVERGASLTQHLLAFGRRQPLAPVPLDLNKVIAEMTNGMLRRSLGERIDIRLVESAGLWPAYADPAQVESAILNLAINARDAMPEGGRLTIETANTTFDERYSDFEEVTPGQYVMIAVSDTGKGMTPDVTARAFEPFFTTKDEGKGSGLGLAMVHGFAKQSNGHVKIYSEPDHGTSVKLYLPRSQHAFAEESQPPVVLPRGDATVLVVEDDAEVRRVAVAQLTDLGYRVLDAADADGLKIFTDNGNIDLLLTDVVLPGRLRGRDLADLVQRASPATRVLFMSGYTENAIVHDGKLDEGTLLLSKPFRREELAKKVALAISNGGRGENVVRLQPR